MEQDGLLGLNQDVQTECHENNKEREVFLAIREREMVIWLGPNVTLDGQISYGNGWHVIISNYLYMLI